MLPLLPLLAQGTSGGPPPPELMAFMAGLFVVMMIVLAVALAIACVVCWILGKWIAVIPVEHRQEGLETWHPWLMLIPLFNFYWVFKLYPVMSRSFQSALGDQATDDCGEQMSMYYCYSVLASLVPILNYIAGPASLVLWILVLVKFNDCKNRTKAMYGA